MKGKELIFISQIKRDGSGVIDISKVGMGAWDEDLFHMVCLSISEKTWIAGNFNCYVVKLKNPK